MISVEVREMMSNFINKSKEAFLNGVDNDEQKAVDFFISELTNTMRSDSMLIRPSQGFGVLKLLREKVPNIKHKVRIDFITDYESFDEGQIWLDLTWDGEFPNTGPVPKCFM